MQDHNYLLKKREEVLKNIKPICDAFYIKDYDYIVREESPQEILRINNIEIYCEYNSYSAIIDELIGYIFLKIYCRNRYIGRYETNVRERITEFWKKELTKREKIEKRRKEIKKLENYFSNIKNRNKEEDEILGIIYRLQGEDERKIMTKEKV